MQIHVEKKRYQLHKPFIITGHVFEYTDVIEVTITDGTYSGHGEAVGTYYLDETADSMMADLAQFSADTHALTHRDIAEALPACGARNALDCALWDFQAKHDGRSVWQTLALQPKQLTTVFTIGLAGAEEMAGNAAKARAFKHLKLKISDDSPIEKLEAIRRARPDATLVIDVNQGWSFAELVEYAPYCDRLNIAMIEQPLERGKDDELVGYRAPVPLGADESCLHLGEFAAMPEKYQVLNIKLDKCGGLTEGLQLVEAAKANGMQLMIGNMTGSSLSMAPAYVVGQFCQFIDIDGPLLQKDDVQHGLLYQDGGEVSIPTPELWG